MDEFWKWWILSMVTINTCINSIVFVVGRKFKSTRLYKFKNEKTSRTGYDFFENKAEVSRKTN